MCHPWDDRPAIIESWITDSFQQYSFILLHLFNIPKLTKKINNQYEKWKQIAWQKFKHCILHFATSKHLSTRRIVAFRFNTQSHSFSPFPKLMARAGGWNINWQEHRSWASLFTVTVWYVVHITTDTAAIFLSIPYSQSVLRLGGRTHS